MGWLHSVRRVILGKIYERIAEWPAPDAPIWSECAEWAEGRTQENGKYNLNIKSNKIIGEEFDKYKESKNKDELDLFSYSFNSDVRKIRFLVHTNQVNYEKNKGRVVIGDITVTCAK